MKIYMSLMILYPFLDFLDFSIVPVFETKRSKIHKALDLNKYCKKCLTYLSHTCPFSYSKKKKYVDGPGYYTPVENTLALR